MENITCKHNFCLSVEIFWKKQNNKKYPHRFHTTNVGNDVYQCAYNLTPNKTKISIHTYILTHMHARIHFIVNENTHTTYSIHAYEQWDMCMCVCISVQIRIKQCSPYFLQQTSIGRRRHTYTHTHVQNGKRSNIISFLSLLLGVIRLTMRFILVTARLWFHSTAW